MQSRRISTVDISGIPMPDVLLFRKVFKVTRLFVRSTSTIRHHTPNLQNSILRIVFPHRQAG